MFEEKIVAACNTRHKKLFRPAQIASREPNTQVKIYNKSAYYVIKDCADITLKYLAHFVYSSLSDPVASLKGKVSEEEIIDFVSRSETETHTRQLLQIVLNDLTSGFKPSLPEPITDFTIDDSDDVYGDYEYGATEDDFDMSEITKSIIDINDNNGVVEKLKAVFL